MPSTNDLESQHIAIYKYPRINPKKVKTSKSEQLIVLSSISQVLTRASECPPTSAAGVALTSCSVLLVLERRGKLDLIEKNNRDLPLHKR